MLILMNKIKDYGKLVMFSHTIFSLSFAVVAFLTACQGRPGLRTIIWAGLALISARTGANALNRIVDARIDASNPRTSNRQLPQGILSVKEAWLLTLTCFFVLVFSAWRLNPLCMVLSPAALFLMFIYSYTKRFTWLCHIVLGITCACAPVGAWLAVTGRFSPDALVIGAANCLWVAGFDIIYGAQDYEFDKANGLYSIPVRFGIPCALKISILFHVGALACLALYGFLNYTTYGFLYQTGFIILVFLVAVQHRIVSPEHLENANFASYSLSQLTSLVLLVFAALDIYF